MLGFRKKTHIHAVCCPVEKLQTYSCLSDIVYGCIYAAWLVDWVRMVTLRFKLCSKTKKIAVFAVFAPKPNYGDCIAKMAPPSADRVLTSSIRYLGMLSGPTRIAIVPSGIGSKHKLSLFEML